MDQQEQNNTVYVVLMQGIHPAGTLGAYSTVENAKGALREAMTEAVHGDTDRMLDFDGYHEYLIRPFVVDSKLRTQEDEYYQEGVGPNAGQVSMGKLKAHHNPTTNTE